MTLNIHINKIKGSYTFFNTNVLLFSPYSAPFVFLIYMSNGLLWLSRQLHANGCISRQGLLREIYWLTGNGIHWEQGFPQDVLSAGLPVFSLNPEMKLLCFNAAIFIIITISITVFLLNINVKIIFMSLASHWISFLLLVSIIVCQTAGSLLQVCPESPPPLCHDLFSSVSLPSVISFCL